MDKNERVSFGIQTVGVRKIRPRNSKDGGKANTGETGCLIFINIHIYLHNKKKLVC